MKPKATLRSFLALAGSALLTISYSHAATITWDGDTSTNWSDAANWTGGVAPANSLTTDIANFNLATYGGNPVYAPTVGTTSINGITIGALNGAMTLTTTNLSIGSGGISIANGAGAFTISGGLTLGAAQSWLNDSLGLFSLSGTVVNSTNLLTIGGSGNTTISGVIGNGAGGLTKNGGGTLTLSGPNTYTGITTVNGGTLLLDKTGTGALAATSALTLGGGTFQVKGATTGATTQTLGALTLTANTGDRMVLDPNNGTSTILTLGNAWTRNAGSTLLIDYSSSNTGTRQVVTAGATTSYVLSNGIYGAILVKDSAGVTGFATRAAGATQAITRFDDTSGSTLLINSNSGTTNFTTLNSTGALAWYSGFTNRSVNSLTIDTTTNGGGTIDMGAASNVLTLTSRAILFKGVGDAILTGGKVGASASEVIVHQTSSTNTLTINSPISAAAGSLTKDGVGTLIVGGTNLFTGAVRVNEGAMRLTNAAATGTNAGGITVQNGAALELSGGLNFIDDALTITGNGISSGGALRNVSGANTYQGAITIGNGGARINSDAGTLTFDVASGDIFSGVGVITFGGAGNITMADPLWSSGAGSVTKDGAGTLTLSAANTYTGSTTVSGGVLTISGANNYTGSTTVSGGVLTVSGAGSIATSAGLSVSTGAQFNYLPTTPATTMTLAAASTLTLADRSTIGETFGSTVGVLGAATVGSNVVNLSMSGAFVDGTPYTVLTAGSGLGTAANYRALNTNYTYALTVSGTSVAITPTAVSAATSLFWLGGSSLGASIWAATDGSAVTPLTNWATDDTGSTRSTVLPGAGTNLTFSATGAANQGAMTLDAPMSANSITVNGTAASPNETNAITLGAGSGQLLTLGSTTSPGITVNSGSGLVTLNAPIQLGIAQSWTNNIATGGNQLAVGGAVNNAGFLLTVAGAGDTTLSGTVLGSGGLTKSGNGTVTLSGANSYSGATTVSGGTLSLTGSLMSASLGNVVVEATGTLGVSDTLTGSATTTSLTYGTTAGVSTVNISTGANISLFATAGANVAGAVSIWNQTGGAVALGNGVEDGRYLANTGYGYMNLSGGSFRTGRFSVVNHTGTTPYGVARIGGGAGTATFSSPSDILFIARGADTIGELTVLPNGIVDNNGASDNMILVGNGEAATGFLNIVGGTVKSDTTSIQIGNGRYSKNTVSMINLGSGSLEIGKDITWYTGGTYQGYDNKAYVNFVGGTVKVTDSGITTMLLHAGMNAPKFISLANTIFGAVTNSTANNNGTGANSGIFGTVGTTQDFTGGVTINTNTLDATISGPLVAPTGGGVAQGNLIVTGGSGYSGPPVVVFSSPTAPNATPAAGYAIISGGVVTGIVITAPGSYAPGDTVSVTLSGGGGTGASVANIAGSSLTANTSGGLNKTGLGTLTLGGSNSYTGITTVSAGTLLVNGSLNVGSAVTVTAGTLGGTGTINGPVTIGNSTGSADAILAPGASIDSLDTGNLTFNSDGSYAVELNGTSVTTDVTNVTGTVAINAATTLTVNVAGTLSASQQYIIVSNDGAGDTVTGTFAGLAQDAIVGNFGGTDLKISYTGGDGNDIVLYTPGSGTPYGIWATGSQPFTGDANGDGVDDGLAWFLGASGPGVSALDKLPLVATPSGFLTLDFDRVNPSSPAKLYVEYGNDLVGWTKVLIPAGSGTFGGDLELVVTPGTPQQLLLKIPTATHEAGGKLFARLSAEEN